MCDDAPPIVDGIVITLLRRYRRVGPGHGISRMEAAPGCLGSAAAAVPSEHQPAAFATTVLATVGESRAGSAM